MKIKIEPSSVFLQLLAYRERWRQSRGLVESLGLNSRVSPVGVGDDSKSAGQMIVNQLKSENQICLEAD